VRISAASAAACWNSQGAWQSCPSFGGAHSITPCAAAESESPITPLSFKKRTLAFGHDFWRLLDARGDSGPPRPKSTRLASRAAAPRSRYEFFCCPHREPPPPRINLPLASHPPTPSESVFCFANSFDARGPPTRPVRRPFTNADRPHSPIRQPRRHYSPVTHPHCAPSATIENLSLVSAGPAMA